MDKATIAIRKSSSSPSPSLKPANTCKPSCATPVSTASSTARRSRVARESISSSRLSSWAKRRTCFLPRDALRRLQANRVPIRLYAMMESRYLNGNCGSGHFIRTNKGRRPQPPTYQEKTWLKITTVAKRSAVPRTANGKTPPKPPWQPCANAKQPQRSSLPTTCPGIMPAETSNALRNWRAAAPARNSIAIRRRTDRS